MQGLTNVKTVNAVTCEGKVDPAAAGRKRRLQEPRINTNGHEEGMESGMARSSWVELNFAVFDLQKISGSRYGAKNRGTMRSELGSTEAVQSL